MSIIETLVEKFPVRRSKAQKEAFRNWFAEECASMGYTAVADEKGYTRNVVVGDPEKAEVIFTAHYDTPAVMPIPNLITPTKIWFYLVYQVAVVLLMIAVAAGVGFLASLIVKDFMVSFFIGDCAMMAVAFLLIFGPANKHNVNDNTSGVAAVMELMKHMPEEQRSKTAFILFDNEEKGLLGSAKYAKKHKEVKARKLLINLDCVGDGEHILFFANKRVRAEKVYPVLMEVMEAQTGRVFHMLDNEKCIYPSDQANFKLGLAVCACNEGKIGLYCDKIHTAKDTVCKQENLDFLTSGLVSFVERI